MKRFFFSAIALAAVVVGCTKSNVLETAPSFETPIEFESYTGKAPMTKATITDLASVQTDGFHATGFIHDATEPYLDKDVTYKTTDDEGTTLETPFWSYDGIAYWPAEGTMDFVAYGKNAVKTATVSNGTTSVSTNLISFSSGSTTEFTFSVPDNVADQEDLVVATPVLDSEKKDKVTFDFKHVLSKVGFSVIANNDNNGVNIIIKNITLNGTFKNTGTVNLKNETPAITALDASTITSYSLFDHDYTKGMTDETDFSGFVCASSTSKQAIFTNTTYDAGDLTTDPTATSTISDNRYLMIMPGQVGDLEDSATPYIEVVYELTEGKEELAKVWLTETGKEDGDNWTFEGGKSYEFVLSVSTSAIGFSVTVQDWTNYFPVTNDDKTTNNGVVNLTPIN